MLVRYLTHPQVAIDPAIPIPRWSLSETGRARVAALTASGALTGTGAVVSSDETKALETARPLAESIACPLQIGADLHENDRSATGFLPPDEFEATADRFFAEPDTSIRGWETARAAQARILSRVGGYLDRHCAAGGGDLLLVGHGAVGTLLYCALANVPIDRRHDQGATGGGNWFAFDIHDRRPLSRWTAMETLYRA